jgi:hypothetical protein
MAIKSERIDRAVEIINYAIQKKISVRAASKDFGHDYTYVKNVKAVVLDLYANQAIPFELYSKFVEAYERYEQMETMETKSVGSNPKVNVNTNIEEEPVDLQKIPEGEKMSFSEDEDNADEGTLNWTWNQNYPPDHIKTVEELMDACKVDKTIWHVKDKLINKWDTTFKLGDLPVTVQNYQVKARLERNKMFVKEHVIGAAFINMVQDYVPPVFDIKPLTTKTFTENNLFEVSIFDLHIGKLAWGGETFENYDVKIARERFLNTLKTLIHRASGYQYSRILFPVGNDFFNSDTINNTTTKGTPQDEDLRWQKTFQVGVRLLVDAINMLKQTGVPVDVMVIPGNHDFERSYYMGAYLEAWFNNDSQVSVNNHASPRKYYKFGKVLLGLTHGGEEKEVSLPMLMATDVEAKPYWSETVYHEWHLGHIHRKRNVNYAILDRKRTVSEDLGVTVRYLSSLTGTEEWHHKKGFVGAIKAGEGFIWNDEAGLMAHLNSNLVL